MPLDCLNIVNPKRPDAKIANGSLYPFYPGFTENFAYSLIESARLKERATVLDPWNGSGTTTAVAAKLGIPSQGFDLNPVMVIVAKARQNTTSGKVVLQQLLSTILGDASETCCSAPGIDPLENWFEADSARSLRQLEQSIQRNCVSQIQNQPLAIRCAYGGVPPVAAFYYTALFRTVRALLTDFSASNPTWIKSPKLADHKVAPKKAFIHSTFDEQAHRMFSHLQSGPPVSDRLGPAYIDVASSDSLPLPDRSIDFVLTSPPYCTRIDYAIATVAELAVLGYSKAVVSETLRRKLIGTSTVRYKVSPPDEHWGATCLTFLDQMKSHTSKASETYYYKNHIQYFQAIYESLSELYRCLNKTGIAVIVVQDSYYKDLHNDLPKIFVEMASTNRLHLKRRVDFPFSRTMARLHPGVRNYRKQYGGVEAVLCFTK